MRGDEATPAADLWALSLVVYEAIAGHSPFAGDNPDWILYRISRGDIPELLTLAPHAPAAASAFLRDCLDLDLRRRPASVREWRRNAQATLSALEGAAPAREPPPPATA